MATPVLRPLSLGEVLDVSFGVYRERFSALVVISLLVRVIPLLWNLVLKPEATVEFSLSLVGYLIVTMIFSAIGIAASTLIVSSSYLNQPLSASEAISRTTPLIWTLVILSGTISIVVAFGFLLLVIPGLILLAGYAVAPAVAVIEAPIKATKAMSRAWQLSKGFRFKILVALLTSLMVVSVPLILVGMVTALVGQMSPAIFEVVVGVTSAFFYPFFYVVISILYYDLRVRKEGLDLELLAGGTGTTPLEQSLSSE